MTRNAADNPRRSLHDTLGESELVVAMFRTLILGVVLVAPVVVAEEAGNRFYLAVTCAGLYCLVTVLLLRQGMRSRWRWRRHLMLLLDIACLTVLIYHRDGLRGGLWPLFYLTVVIGAMWFSLPGAVAAAALVTLGSIFGTLLTVPPDQVYAQLYHHLSPQVLQLFLTAVLCAYLAEAWHAEQRRAEQQEQVMAQFRKQISWAQELQTLILPAKLPPAAGLEVGVRTRQADLVVGGDYYDALAFEDGTLGLCVADVSGKSIPGQLRLPLVKYAFRVVAAQLREPQAVVEALNRLLYDELPPEMFVSLVYVLLDPREGVATLAGNSWPPLHLTAGSGAVRTLDLQGVVLGMEPDLRYQPLTVPLQPDDYLVLYTDGVIEAKDRRGHELEVVGLTQIVNDATPESAQDLANLIFSGVEEHEVGAKRDDLTVLAVRRTAR
ncbi:MAG: serine/threonine-protein phosphatase [Fimbriimonadaceae bacterium]|nr:serine/threonine-protein phosphatase [Fimbriimonadaceae bacterium]